MIKKMCTQKKFMQISFVLLLLMIWEIVARLEIYPKAMFPSLEVVFVKLMSMISTGELITQAIYSISIVIVTMCLSLVIGLMAVAASTSSRYIRVNIELLNATLGPIPGVAVLPFIILWFGISQTSMNLIMIHAMVWPIWLTLMLSKDKLDQKYSKLMRAFKVKSNYKWMHVYLQGMVPDIITALEIAWGRGWRTLLSVEMIFGIVGDQSGLGWLVYERRMYMDTAGMLSGLLVIALCGIIFESLLFKSKRLEAYIESHYQN